MTGQTGKRAKRSADGDRVGRPRNRVEPLPGYLCSGRGDGGGRLIACKAKVKHGQWLPWLEREFGWAERTARNFMSVAEMSKSAMVADLSVDIGGLYRLAAPSTPSEVISAWIFRALNHRVNEPTFWRLHGARCFCGFLTCAIR